MEIEYGAEVIDRNGKVLGTVDHLMHNTWTGDVSKFVIRRKPPDSDLFFSTGDVSEAVNGKVKLSISLNEVT